MTSILLAVVFLFAMLLAVAAIVAIQLLGGWPAVRVRIKLWNWRRRLDTVDHHLRALAGEVDGVTPEEVYDELDRAYPGTFEAKREQLVAERDYLRARIAALERDRRAG